jgi:NADH dehydrogenase (ubiquinone) 1 beta subcomplex subunit 5
MEIKPSEFQWKKFKDMIHFYTLLGVIPLVSFSFFMNLTQGQAQLADIPEGYTPQYWEYERRPVSRFFYRYLWPRGPQEFYELRLDALNRENEKVIMRKVEERVQNVMRARNDYESWYYTPIVSKDARVQREFYRKIEDRLGYRDNSLYLPGKTVAERTDPTGNDPPL